ncbi:hypothetical protein [Zavarzinia compransoris]|uniref:Metallo-beta-lactamase domain-containing protein n=1 Tax=Zavarzinia compransoris TaxID=1264899 RepID=A0A317E0B9_9PROT|nr:hypothetical protein [Zavarzinia compransoris]PWR19884.1 hypothetical protein DKG75_15630 [Zavarzinia compransoris]TDP45004.1 metallo-beta-lactamase class B [Zavarzinia compransoris]
MRMMFHDRRHGFDDMLAARAPGAALSAFRRLPPPSLFPVADGLYVHVSFANESGEALASNGLVVVGRQGALLVDTAATHEDTARLIDAVDRLTSGAPLQVYVTEARADRLGGLAAVHERGLRSLGHETTVAAAMSAGLPLPRADWQGEAMAFEVGERLIEVFHPGAAQTRANTLVYVEDADCLYGGSLIRPSADLRCPAQPIAPQPLQSTIDRFGSPGIVVPGRGEPSDGSLLALNLAALSA